MAKLLLSLAALTVLFSLSGCSTTRIENAHFKNSTINCASWKSQAGIGEDGTIEAITSPKTDTSLTGL
jgi:outer membrane protein assembly factor BamE (lipoprotein component of BamABCDE complex)